jgi:hypothetical protein
MLVFTASQDPGRDGHANEVGQAIGRHLGHDIGAVDFDGAGADSEVERNHLVGFASHQPFKHLALAL